MGGRQGRKGGCVGVALRDGREGEVLPLFIFYFSFNRYFNIIHLNLLILLYFCIYLIYN